MAFFWTQLASLLGPSGQAGPSGPLTTCSTLTNQSQVGGYGANDQIPALMHLSADSLRRNITVS